MKLLEQLLAEASREELVWMSGYFAGAIRDTAAPVTAPAPATAAATKAAARKLTIAYGTETGNAKRLATAFAAKAKKAGIGAKVVSLEQYRPDDLKREEYFLTVISTQGEGDPPAGAKKFYDHIHNNGFRLEGMKYGVLALGDTAYPLFCKAGEDVDRQLAMLGGEAIVPLQKCDTDYEAEADSWFAGVLDRLSMPVTAPAAAPVEVAKPRTTGKKYYAGVIRSNINLNDRGSLKQTHHIEIEAEDVDYRPGDALGVVPRNSPAEVTALLELLQWKADQVLPYRNETQPAGTWLEQKVSVRHLSERVISAYAALCGHNIPATRMGLCDLLRIYPLPATVPAESLLQLLEPITPRLYSISSAPDAHPGEIHLTVGLEQFLVNEERKQGHCSDYLCCLPEGSPIEFYIHRNSHFQLPEGDRDCIMIGPGTGIAPFRSFIAQRDAEGSAGRNWLFFGDQHFTTDFLYQTELLNWLETGTLTRLNVAFSRDGKDKLYVQHRIRQHAAECYQWLQEGASLYICGKKEPMSKDVENTLLQVIAEEGGHTPEAARAYLDQLEEEGRYCRDVY